MLHATADEPATKALSLNGGSKGDADVDSDLGALNKAGSINQALCQTGT